jgi:hypothetical protein
LTDGKYLRINRNCAGVKLLLYINLDKLLTELIILV